MEYAYSLINRKNIYAASSQYRQNLDDQLVCPECFEQVFKKEMWVPSQQATTHFFSHYAGRFESCSLRTPGENSDLNKGDSQARLQKMSEFNRHFRSEITKGFEKILGKSTAKSMKDSLEFAERISIEKLRVGEINKLSEKLLIALSDPINLSIDESLEALEDAICPVYRHLSTSYGENNLYFVAAISLLLSYHEESPHLETLLDKKFIKQADSLTKLMLGNSVLLFAHYINWNKSLEKVKDFIEEFTVPITQESERKQSKIEGYADKGASKPVQEYIEYCTVCKNPFLSKGAKTCSGYCAAKAASDAKITTISKNNLEYESWLSNQPWDKENVELHQVNKKYAGVTPTKKVDNNSPPPKIEDQTKKTVWIKTKNGLQNKDTGAFIYFADTLRSVFPIPGYSVNGHQIGFIKDSEIEGA